MLTVMTRPASSCGAYPEAARKVSGMARFGDSSMGALLASSTVAPALALLMQACRVVLHGAAPGQSKACANAGSMSKALARIHRWNVMTALPLLQKYAC